MSAAMPKFLRQAHEEWRANPRLRWGALLAGAIAVVYLCLLLVDWRRDLHEQYQQRTLQLYKMAALSGQSAAATTMAHLDSISRSRRVATAGGMSTRSATTVAMR